MKLVEMPLTMRIQRQKEAEELRTSGGVYVHLCKIVQESINDGHNWVWIHDKVSKEKVLASEFERLSRKYAVIFKSRGFKSGDVVHLMVDNHYHNFFALGGVWHLGGAR